MKFPFLKSLFSLILSISTFYCTAQICCQQSPTVGSQHQYTYNTGAIVFNPMWYLEFQRGTINSQTQNGTTYTVTITWNTVGNETLVLFDGSSPVAQLSISVLSPPPPAPVATNASNIVNNSFTANWQAASGATSYLLYIGDTNSPFTPNVMNGSFSSITSLTSGTGLTANKAYYYCVKSVNSGGSSAYSNVIGLVTAPAIPASVVTSNIKFDSFTASWIASPGTSFYELQVSTSSGFGAGTQTYTTTATPFNVSGLAQNTTYYFRMRAVNSSNNPVSVYSLYSSTITITTPYAPPSIGSPSSVTANSFVANWGTVSGATQYLVDVSPDNFANFFLQNYPVSGATSLQVSGLLAGTTYYYRVRAQNSGWTTDYSATQTVTTAPPTPIIGNPSSITATSFWANWTTVTGASSGYQVEVSTNDLFSSPLVGTYSSSGSSVNIPGLESGKTYYYRVRAGNPYGWSDNSSFNTVLTLPAAPTLNTAANITVTTFTASWIPVLSATSYVLEVSDNNFSSVLLTFSGITATTREVQGLITGKMYYCRVRALNASGASNNSTILTVATALVAPVAIGPASITSSSFTARWNASTNAVDYRLDVATTADFSPLSILSTYNNLTVSATTSPVTGLLPKKTYYYRVRAVNATGTSSNSNYIIGIDLDHNYVRTIDVLVPSKTTYAAAEAGAITERISVHNFFDGLGRPLQTVSNQASATQKDLVQPFAYDAYGREVKKYLPYTDVNETTGWYKPNALRDPNSTGTAQAQYMTGKQHTFYQLGGNLPVDTAYSRIRYETSPLNRTIEQGSPGVAWQPDATDAYTSTDRTIKSSYETNEGASEVLLWTYTYPTASYPLGLVNTGTGTTPAYYPVERLYRIRTKNEDNFEVIEYKDKMGKVVLKRVQAKANSPALGDTDYASTYYIYDGFGNLVVVIPPEATKRLGTEYYQSGSTDATKDSFLRRWAFRYTYDAKKRMSQKQVPGTAPSYIVYDGRDRVVLTQDGNQRTDGTTGLITKKDWTYTKYDVMNRPIMTGIYTHTTVVDQSTMQTYVNGQIVSGNQFYEDYNTDGTYTTRVFPTTTPNLLTVSYYDNYNFKTQWLQSDSYNYVSDTLSQTVPPMATPYTHPATGNLRVVGKPTGKKVRVLDGGPFGGYTWLKSAMYYDDKYRVIQSKEDNYKGGVDRNSTLVDFTGKVLISKTAHFDADVTWKDMLGVLQSGNILYKSLADSASSGWGTSGAASVQQLSASQNGWMEFVASETYKTRAIGLSDVNTNANHNTIDYSWHLKSNGQAHVFENGTDRGSMGTYKAGDVFKIDRTGTTITYYQNNALKFTSSVASSSLLMVDAAFLGTGSRIVNVRTNFGSGKRRVIRRIEYDNANRMIRTWHKVFGETEVLLSHNTYNELGQLVDKKLHSTNSGGTDAKQSIDYLYNIRGWLTKINNSDVSTVASGDAVRDYFGMELGYNGAIGLANGALYNGNISGMKWSINQGYGTIKEIGYRYSYDPMNRLTKADHRQLNGTWQPGQFHEKGFTYDLNGNILTLGRYSEAGQIDTLKYDYGLSTTGSNKLLYVEDKTTSTVNKAKGFVDGNTGTGTDYIYDANGNMTQDRNKGIGPTAGDVISYNFLNLPETVTKGGNSIRYIYDATGRKLAQVLNTGATGVVAAKHTDYAGEFIYENDVLQFVNHEEGRITVGSNKVIVKDAGESITTMTTLNANLLAHTTTATGEKYIKVTSSGAGRAGVSAVGGTLVAGPNERYRIRVKGYSLANTVYISVKANGADLNWPGYPLPTGVVNESWVEQIVTTPPGTTTLTAGFNWSSSTAGQEFYINEVEVTKLIVGTPEYQYHLKDHLGNVRVTFSSKNETESLTATLETATANADQANFLRYANAKRVNATIFDRTNGASTGYSQRLNGSANEKYGLARSIAVMPGDVVNMEVYAKYVDTNTANWTAALNTLMGQIAANTAGVVVDGVSYSTSTSTFPFPGVLSTAGSTGGPKAYLNWIFFDKNWTFVPAQSGYMRMTTVAREYGQDVAHQRLFGAVTAQQSGYMYIYLSNEETTPVEVYFDDFKVEQVKLPVVQADDYYPFGLTFNSYQRENASSQDYKFGGKEEQTELALNNVDWGWRQYDPVVGRWQVIDQWADKYHATSPYVFVRDNPISNREIDGRYFEGKDEKKAAKIEKKAEKRADKLERKADRIEARGGNGGDLRARVGELRQSGQDIRDMRSDQGTQYRYAKFGGNESRQQGLDGPTTTGQDVNGQNVVNGRGHNVVTMFTERNMSSMLHESRHGGQHFRGEANAVTGEGNGVADEVSAYRAQYSYRGKLSYDPWTDYDNPMNIGPLLQRGASFFRQTLTNIDLITPGRVNTFVDNPGLNQRRTYPPEGMPLDQWNNN